MQIASFGYLFTEEALPESADHGEKSHKRRAETTNLEKTQMPDRKEQAGNAKSAPNQRAPKGGALALAALLSLAAAGAWADDYPTLRGGVLTLPRVDTPEQAGRYLDVSLKLTENGSWALLGYTDGGTYASMLYATTAEAIVTDSFPVQVLLRVNGYFSSGCGELGPIDQRLVDGRFEVVVHQHSSAGPNVGCTLAMVPTQTIIPLPVYGLTAGTYQYSVNGGAPGSFTLGKDNIIEAANPR